MIKPYICVVWTECPGELSISRPLSLGARWCRRQWAVSFAVGANPRRCLWGDRMDLHFDCAGGTTLYVRHRTNYKPESQFYCM